MDKSMGLDGSSQIPHFLQLFPENLMNTPKHTNLHETLLVMAKSVSFDGFSQTPTLYATFR